MSNRKQVAIIAGQGIGPEVIAQARRVLDWFVARRGLGIVPREALYGSEAYRRTGKVVPDETATVLRTADASCSAPPAARLTTRCRRRRREGNLLRVRRSLDLYANLRPIVAIPALNEASSLKSRVLAGVDFIILRELSSGLYFGEPRGIETLPNGEKRGPNTHAYTSSEIRRVARFGFELARTRRGPRLLGRQVECDGSGRTMAAGSAGAARRRVPRRRAQPHVGG
jgi:3-isopropylmalate dehydrogenase